MNEVKIFEIGFNCLSTDLVTLYKIALAPSHWVMMCGCSVTSQLLIELPTLHFKELCQINALLMFLASLVCRAKDCRSGRTKAQGGTIGGKQNGNLWFCGIFSNVGSRPGPFFFFFFPWFRLRLRERFPCQHTFLPLSQSPQRLLAGGCGTLVWDGPGPVFTSGWAGS